MTSLDIAEPPSDFRVELIETASSRALLVRLGGPHEALSWAIVNGGRTRTDSVVFAGSRGLHLSASACSLAASAGRSAT